jgi:aminoglycoside phosphotransferase (APT) family kinase protein
MAAMHEGQVHIDADIARETIAEQFPEYRFEPIIPIASIGTDNAIFRVGSGVSARFPLRPMAASIYAEKLGREVAAMEELAVHCAVATPRPIAIGSPGPLFPMPWSLQSWIEGNVATHESHAASDRFALGLANLIASMRAVDTRGRRFDRPGRGGHLPDHDAWMSTCFDKSRDLLDVDRLSNLWGRLRELPRFGADLMNHGDLIPANLLVRSEQLIGILDCGGFGPADPALDLVAGWHLLDRDRREILRARLGADDVEWQRGAAWAFQQAMGLVWYYRLTNPAMSALGRSTLDRILEDGEIGSSS